MAGKHVARKRTFKLRSPIETRGSPTPRPIDRAWRLYRVDLDGENLEPLLSHGDGREPTSAEGSIVFISDRSGTPAMYTVPSTGGAPTAAGKMRRANFTSSRVDGDLWVVNG